MRQINRVALAVVLCGLAGGVSVGSAWAQFTQGRLAVSRVGDGTNALTSSGNAVFIEQFNTSGTEQTASYTVALPTTGTTNAIVTSGVATGDGVLTLTGNGQYLTYYGYGRPLGSGTSNLTGTDSATVNRVVARIGADGAVDTTTRLNDAQTGGAARAAYSADGSSFYMVGSTAGVRYAVADFDNTPDTSISINTTITNTRVVSAFNNNLYFSTGAGNNGTSTVRGIYRVENVNSAFPTTSTTVTRILDTGASSSPYDFFFADDLTLYVAEDGLGGTSASAGLQKYTRANISSAFTLSSTFTLSNLSGVGNVGFRGLAGFVNQSGDVELYATTSDYGLDSPTLAQPGNRLVKITDRTATGNTSTVSVLAQAANGTMFRGVDFTPFVTVQVPEPGSVAFILMGGVLGAGVMRRRRMFGK